MGITRTSTGLVTIKSIAEALGISSSTVAKALNDHSSISEATKQAARNRVKELNYLPEDTARALRSKSARTFGVVINDRENDSYAMLVKSIAVACLLGDEKVVRGILLEPSLTERESARER
jgi:DNA-binding LacI/PurR family transcriptional regulator